MGHRDSSASFGGASPLRAPGSGAFEPTSGHRSLSELIASWTKWLMIGVLRFYRVALSPLMPVGCKFHPSCSQYALEAVSRYGVWRGSRLAFIRLVRCSPFTRGGFDPVPDSIENSKKVRT